MPTFSLLLPGEICAELGRRTRTRRLALNLSIEELAHRVGISDRTLRSFEQTGRSTLSTFVRVLEALNALPDLQSVLDTQPHSIEGMRLNAQSQERKRAVKKKPPPLQGKPA